MRSIALAIPENAAEKPADAARCIYRVQRQLTEEMHLEIVEQAAEIPSQRLLKKHRPPVSL
jgi:hypothetical protein